MNRTKFIVLAIFLLLLGAFPPSVNASIATEQLIKGTSHSSVYYFAYNGKRYVFPNEKVYRSWYPNFSGVTTITDAELAAITIGGNVHYKPGMKLLKITTDPKVYATDWNGKLRWVTSESIAAELYGPLWSTNIDDVPDTFFAGYAISTPINSPDNYNVETVRSAAGVVGIDTYVNPGPRKFCSYGSPDDCATQGFTCPAELVTGCSTITGAGGFCTCRTPCTGPSNTCPL